MGAPERRYDAASPNWNELKAQIVFGIKQQSTVFIVGFCPHGYPREGFSRVSKGFGSP